MNFSSAVVFPFSLFCALSVIAGYSFPSLPSFLVIFIILASKNYSFSTLLLFIYGVYIGTSPEVIKETQSLLFFPEKIIQKNFFQKEPLIEGAVWGWNCRKKVSVKLPPNLATNALYCEGCSFKQTPHAIIISPTTVSRIEQLPSLTFFRYTLHQSLIQLIRKTFTTEDAKELYSILFTGVKCGESTYSLFSKTGLSHLLVISGFHFGLLLGLIRLISSPLSTSSRAIFSLFCLVLLRLFLGYSGSVERAFEGAFLASFAPIVGRKIDSLHILSLTFIIGCCVCPQSISDLSVILTYSATFVVLIISKNSGNTSFNKSHSQGVVFVRKLLVVNGLIYFFLSPLMLIYFGYIPLVGCITNLCIPICIAILLIIFPFCLLIPYVANVVSTLISALYTFLHKLPTHKVVVYPLSESFGWFFFISLILLYLWILKIGPKILCKPFIVRFNRLSIRIDSTKT